MNQYIYFDRDGVVLKSTDTEEEGIPLFETDTMTTFSLYDKVKVDDESLLDQIMNLSRLLEAYDVKWDRVVFDASNNATLYSGDIDVELGKREDYDVQLSALSQVLKKAAKEKISGSINMVNYEYKDDIVIKKKTIQKN